MTNFQSILETVNAEVKARNLETIAQINELLEANGYDVHVKIIKDSSGYHDCVAVYSGDDGHYARATLDENPASLLFALRCTIAYYDIDIQKL